MNAYPDTYLRLAVINLKDIEVYLLLISNSGKSGYKIELGNLFRWQDWEE